MKRPLSEKEQWIAKNNNLRKALERKIAEIQSRDTVIRDLRIELERTKEYSKNIIQQKKAEMESIFQRKMDERRRETDEYIMNMRKHYNEILKQHGLYWINV